MAESKRNHSEKPHGFWSFCGSVFVRAWQTAEETIGRLLTWSGIASGPILAVILLYYRGSKASEESGAEQIMNHWVLFIPSAVWVLWFLGHLAKAPYKIYKEQHEEFTQICQNKNEEIEYLRYQMNQLVETKRLNVEVALKDSSFCFLRVTNPNSETFYIRLKLINIEPPMKGPPDLEGNNPPWPQGRHIYYSNNMNLTSAIFQFIDCNDGELNAAETGNIDFFVIAAGEKTRSIIFNGKWTNQPYQLRFIADGEHILTFTLSGMGLKTQTHKLKVRFNQEGWQHDLIE